MIHLVGIRMKMSSSNEDRKLEIRLVELQIRHQHIASFFTVIISVGMSVSVSIFVGYLSIGILLNQVYWIIDSVVVLIGGMVFTYLAYREYLRRIRALKKEIEEIRKEHIW